MIGAPLAGILAAAGAGGPKGIQYVGGTTGQTPGRTVPWTISLTSLTGGIASAPAAGDFVVVFYGLASSGESSALALSVSGYTEQALIFSNDSSEAHLLVATKRLTGADTSISLSETYSGSNAAAAVVHVFRGVDATTPLDVAIQTATFLNTPRPNPPAVTPLTAGAWVVAGGAGAHDDAVDTFTSSSLSGFLSVGQQDAEDVTVGAGYVADASGAVDPGLFGYTGFVTASNAAAAATLALRPANPPS